MKLSETQKLARFICRMVTDDCVMDEKPERSLCKMSNCQMMPIAMEALVKTGRRRRLWAWQERPSAQNADAA